MKDPTIEWSKRLENWDMTGLKINLKCPDIESLPKTADQDTAWEPSHQKGPQTARPAKLHILAGSPVFLTYVTESADSLTSLKNASNLCRVYENAGEGL